MAKNDDFELDFDFEKEYGISEDIMSLEYNADDDDFDIDLLADIPMAVKAKPAPQSAEPPVQVPVAPAAEPEDTAADDDNFLDEYAALLGEPDQDEPQADETTSFNEFDGIEEPVMPAAPVAPPMPQRQPKASRRQPKAPRVNPLKAQPPQSNTPPVNFEVPQPSEEPKKIPLENTAPPPRRRKRTQEQIIKEDYLPVGIAGVALLLCLIFIIGSVVRNIDQNNEKVQNEILASEQAASEAIRLEEEAAYLLEQAAIKASSYDYQGAIELLDSFSGDMNKFTQILSDRGKYSQLLSTVVEISNYGQLPNLSFNALIADPDRAFADEKYASAYNQNFITIDEFSKILEQLYANGYVLVNFDSFVDKTTDAAGNISYVTKPIYLPADKKPFMLTETLVNYFGYQIDGDGDGKADAKGGGFASKMIVKDGEITCEMVDSEGNTVYGAYDLVPILNAFIEEHPDFAYRGARATLAVTGKEGIFGHRINSGDSAEVAAATELVQALRDQGYLIACNTYENLNYNNNKATDIQADLKKWTDEITPVLGEVDILVFARGSDISDYTGPKFNVLYSSGFRFFVSSSTNGIPSTEVNRTYIRQYRIMVTGSLMVNSPNTLANYFKVADVISGERGF